MFLALIAKEKSLDHLHMEFRIDGGTVFHRHGNIGVRSLEGDSPFRKLLVNQSLKFARRLKRSLIGYCTDIKHDVFLISPAVYHSIINNKNEC